MDTKVRVVMAVTVLHDHVVADLKADAIAVVVAGFHVAKRVAIAILQKDATSVVAIEVFAILTISVERNVLDQYVCRVFAGQEWKQRCAGWLAAGPEIFAKSVVQLEAISIASHQRSLNDRRAVVMRICRLQNDAIADLKRIRILHGDFLIVPV